MRRPVRSIRRLAPAVAMATALGLVTMACGGDGSDSGGGDGDGASATTPQADEQGVQGLVGGPADAGTPVSGGRLVVGLEAETQGMNPATIPFAVSGHYIASAVYETLVALDEEGTGWVPLLAESVEPNDDFTVWTFTIRDGVVFHDGTPLTGEAVQANLDEYRRSGITGLLLQSITDVSVDGQVVTVTLDQPWVDFPLSLTSQGGYILEPSTFTDGTALTEPVGTGPFRFTEHVENERWRFERNPDYWQEGLPYLDEIEFQPIPDHGERLARLESGELDAMITYRPADILAAREDPDLKRVEITAGEEDVLAINTQRPPFDDLTARRALAHATDAARWRDEINLGVHTPATGPFAPGQAGFAEDNGYPEFDLAKASELVAEYESRTGQPLAFTYIATGAVDDTREAQLLIADWEAAGMEVELVSREQRQLIAQAVLGDYQVSDWRNFGYPNPDVDYVWWHSTSVQDPSQGISLNVSRYIDPELDAALDEARGSTDPAVRDDAYQRVARQLGENVAYIWLAHVDWMLAADARVSGIYAADNGTVSTLGQKPWIGSLWLG